MNNNQKRKNSFRSIPRMNQGQPSFYQNQEVSPNADKISQKKLNQPQKVQRVIQGSGITIQLAKKQGKNAMSDPSHIQKSQNYYQQKGRTTMNSPEKQKQVTQHLISDNSVISINQQAHEMKSSAILETSKQSKPNLSGYKPQRYNSGVDSGIMASISPVRDEAFEQYSKRQSMDINHFQEICAINQKMIQNQRKLVQSSYKNRAGHGSLSGQRTQISESAKTKRNRSSSGNQYSTVKNDFGSQNFKLIQDIQKMTKIQNQHAVQKINSQIQNLPGKKTSQTRMTSSKRAIKSPRTNKGSQYQIPQYNQQMINQAVYNNMQIETIASNINQLQNKVSRTRDAMGASAVPQSHTHQNVAQTSSNSVKQMPNQNPKTQRQSKSYIKQISQSTNSLNYTNAQSNGISQQNQNNDIATPEHFTPIQGQGQADSSKNIRFQSNQLGQNSLVGGQGQGGTTSATHFRTKNVLPANSGTTTIRTSKERQQPRQSYRAKVSPLQQPQIIPKKIDQKKQTKGNLFQVNLQKQLNQNKKANYFQQPTGSLFSKKVQQPPNLQSTVSQGQPTSGILASSNDIVPLSKKIPSTSQIPSKKNKNLPAGIKDTYSRKSLQIQQQKTDNSASQPSLPQKKKMVDNTKMTENIAEFSKKHSINNFFKSNPDINQMNQRRPKSAKYQVNQIQKASKSPDYNNRPQYTAPMTQFTAPTVPDEEDDSLISNSKIKSITGSQSQVTKVSEQKIVNQIIENFQNLDQSAQKKLLKVFLEQNRSETIEQLSKSGNEPSTIKSQNNKSPIVENRSQNLIKIQNPQQNSIQKKPQTQPVSPTHPKKSPKSSQQTKMSMDLSNIDKSIVSSSRQNNQEKNEKNRMKSARISQTNQVQEFENMQHNYQDEDQKSGQQSGKNELDDSQVEYENYLKIFFRKRYIPKNVITKYAFATRVGFIPNNPSKVNQDSYILVPGVEGPSLNYKHMFGVCDGHGSSGHLASAYIKEELNLLVKKFANQKLQEKGKTLDESDYKQIFEDAFLECDENMAEEAESKSAILNTNEESVESKPNFDVKLSGSTVCTVLFDGNRVHCANAGDSRAIKVQILLQNGLMGIGQVNESQSYKIRADQLSEDHKPDLPEEQKRILEAGGRIDSFHDSLNHDEPIGPQRVWLKEQSMPGLAMSRSLGDQVAHSVGVSSIPEVKSFIVGAEDKFVVIGSDGIFEFLTNEDVARIVIPFFKINQPEAAANAVVKAAYKRWREEEEVVDDITAVVIFLEPLMAYGQPPTFPFQQRNKHQRGYFTSKSSSQPNLNLPIEE